MGADIDTQDSYCYTPLMRASYHGHEALVRLLLELGADITLRTKGGNTALSLAHFRASIVALVEARGAPAKKGFFRGFGSLILG